ncbi:hypothetical protein J6590_009470 [Homalodisca vitripennis]|nr:hypothetical protein J6590_009470 [Homalodisca vitripennis]
MRHRRSSVCPVIQCDATYCDAMRHVNTDYTETLKCVSSHTVRCGAMQLGGITIEHFLGEM